MSICQSGRSDKETWPTQCKKFKTACMDNYTSYTLKICQYPFRCFSLRLIYFSSMIQTDSWIIVFTIGYTNTILFTSVIPLLVHQYQFRPRRAAPKTGHRVDSFFIGIWNRVRKPEYEVNRSGGVGKTPVLYCGWILICLLNRHNEFVSCVVICIGQCPHPCLSILQNVHADC